MNVLEQHERIILLFSGGKDSLCCLMLLKDHWDKIMVTWVNPGNPTESLSSYMDGIKKRVPNFTEVNGNQPEYIHKWGWPADVVPVRSTKDDHGAKMQGITFVPYTACCRSNLWQPMHKFVEDYKATLVILGQRKDESLRNRHRDMEFNHSDGVMFWHPINEWIGSEVFEYLGKIGEPLPPGYVNADRSTSSTDCKNCTAYLDHGISRFAELKKTDYKEWLQVKTALETLDERIKHEFPGVPNLG